MEITENRRYALRIYHEPGLAGFLASVGYVVYYSYSSSIFRCSSSNFSGMKLSHQPGQYDEFRDLKLEIRTTTEGLQK